MEDQTRELRTGIGPPVAFQFTNQRKVDGEKPSLLPPPRTEHAKRSANVYDFGMQEVGTEGRKPPQQAAVGVFDGAGNAA